MGNVRIELIGGGVRQLLRSQEVQNDLKRRAAAIAAAASVNGGEFGVSSQVGASRARAIVFTADAKAEVLEATQRVLTRAIDAGRG